MVHEAALSVFTIPINIREELSPVLKTYPPPGKEFRHYSRDIISKVADRRRKREMRFASVDRRQTFQMDTWTYIPTSTEYADIIVNGECEVPATGRLVETCNESE
ncbi:uncharacterized protein EI90DRAFT_3133088 [Cantharellus anzutake]|uniref:uncharacterized protein n=1 Tax=Cantharellus anzutake TaxID=1750568 RepID=UPI001908D935|nr:uncharacterized protein EI90DRAFT_3133088 [Cantharellus anzutake]KAF8318589.1 hypothetical protein EI90DRAFT_3133088 [Cantharellus anzutake]